MDYVSNELFFMIFKVYVASKIFKLFFSKLKINFLPVENSKLLYSVLVHIYFIK